MLGLYLDSKQNPWGAGCLPGPHLSSHYNLGFGSWAVHTACVLSSLACGTHQAAKVQKREGADEASQPASQPETRPLRSTEATEFTL